MITEFGIAGVSIIILWLAVASLFDIKRREVPDWLNFSFIAVACFVRISYSIILWDYWILLEGLFGFLVAFVIALLMYYGKQWGGGDSKVLLGIGILLGFNFNFAFFDLNSWPIFLSFFLNTFIVGAFYGLVYSVILMITHWKNFVKQVKEFNNIILFAPFFAAVVLLIIALFFNKAIQFVLLSAAIALILAAYVIIFVNLVTKACMYKHVAVSKLVEGDWIAEEVKVKGKVICSQKDLCLDEKQIKLLKKFKVKNVLVKEGIPFVPSFFFSFIATIIFGNIFGLIFGMF
jgi:Flp pilus assembly protein protease CpaA